MARTREEINAYRREYYRRKKQDPEWWAERQKKDREYYDRKKSDPEYMARRSSYQKQYENSESGRAKYSELRTKRRARIRNAEGVTTANDFTVIKSVLGDNCLCCGSSENIEMDHVVPISRGGCNWPSNFQPLCVHCNRSKATKSTDYRSICQLEMLRDAFA